MSTPSSANPTLTIVALALRQADYIERQMGRRAL
jgi:choline dehydrogenase-like flavoprotein